MPQPYRGRLTPRIGGEAALKRPHLSAYVAAISTEWERVEEMWGVILARALGSSAGAGIEIFHSVSGAAAQSSILQTGIKRAIAHDPDLQKRLSDLLTEHRRRAQERNRVVHAQWGYFAERDDVLVAAEPGWLARTHANANDMWREAEEKGSGPPEFKMPVTVYTLKDFEETLLRIRRVGGDQQAFFYLLDRSLLNKAGIRSSF